MNPFDEIIVWENITMATNPRRISVSEDIAVFDVWENRRRYWVGGTDSWNATQGTKWSTSSGGVGGAAAPTSIDDVYFDANSGANTITFSATNNCKNLDFTGFTGTITGTSQTNVYGSTTFVAGMTLSGYTGRILFCATSAGQTITTGGKTMYCEFNFNGAGGGWVLQDNLSIANSKSLLVYAGTLDTNGKTVTVNMIQTDGTAARGITLGASTIQTYNWIMTSVTALTFNAGTSNIYWASTGTAAFSGGGLTYYNAQFHIPSAHNTYIAGANTFNNLTITNQTGYATSLTLYANQTVNGTFTSTGTSAISRILIKSSVLGTQRTITAATTSLSYTDFQDTLGAGGGAWTGTSLGNALGNSGITFTTPVTRYAVGITGSVYWDSTSVWSDTSGGSSGFSVPICHDTVYLNGSSGSGTINIGPVRLGADVSFSGFTGTALFYTTNARHEVFGSMTLGSGMTISSTTPIYFMGRSAHSVTSNTKSVYSAEFYAFGGTYTLQDNFSSTGIVKLRNGTIDANDFNFTASSFDSSISGTRAIVMGSGTWNMTGSGNSWYVGTGLSVTQETSTIELSDATASTKTFTGSSKTYYILKLSGAGIGTYQINNSNTFNTITSTKTNAYSLVFSAGSTQTVTNFTVSGTPGNLVQITSSTTALHGLTKTGTGNIICNYLDIAHSYAQPSGIWYARDSTNNQGIATTGSGWTFGEPSPFVSETISVTENQTLIRDATIEEWETITTTEFVSLRVFTPDAVETTETIYVYDMPWIWISDPGGTNRYWIGGAGSWNDSAHWAFTSGGTGGAPIPTPYDDVFIDSNSGFGSGGTITLNGAYWSCMCHDFTANTGYTTADKYRIDYVTSDLAIYGSATFERSLYMQSGTWVYFVSNEANNTITSNDCWFSAIYFGYDDDGPWPLSLVDGTTVTYNLYGDFYLEQELYIERGIINFNDSRFQINSSFQFYADEWYSSTFTGYGRYKYSYKPTINLQSSLISLDGNGYESTIQEYDGATVTLNPGTSTIRFSNIDSFVDYFSLYGDTATGYIAKSFNRIEVLGNRKFQLYGFFTVDDLVVYPQPSASYYIAAPVDAWTAGSLTVNNLTLRGAVNDLVYIASDGNGYTTTITNTGPDIEVNYAGIRDVTGAGPGDWFVGEKSSNISNNNNLFFYNRTINTPDRNVKTAIDFYKKDSSWNSYSMYSGTKIKTGQSFFNILGTTLDEVELYLGRENFPTGNMQVKIYAHSGVYGTSSVPTGPALASSDLVDIDDVFLTRYLAQRVRFPFSGANRITLDPSTPYVLSLEYSGGDSSNYVYVTYRTTASVHSGNCFYSNDGVTYTPNATNDFYFVVYGLSELADPIYEAISITESPLTQSSDLTNYVSVEENISVSEHVSSLIYPLLINKFEAITVLDTNYQYVVIPGTLFTTYNFDIGSQYYVSFDYDLSSGHIMLYQGTQLIFDSGAWFVRGVYQNVFVRENVSIIIT